MNNLCADIGYKSINHSGEQLCGDHIAEKECISLKNCTSSKDGNRTCEEEWERDREDLKENLAFVRVENLQDRCFSEFGTIGVMGSMGGVLRTA